MVWGESRSHLVGEGWTGMMARSGEGSACSEVGLSYLMLR